MYKRLVKYIVLSGVPSQQAVTGSYERLELDE